MIWLYVLVAAVVGFALGVLGMVAYMAKEMMR